MLSGTGTTNGDGSSGSGITRTKVRANGEATGDTTVQGASVTTQADSASPAGLLSKYILYIHIDIII